MCSKVELVSLKEKQGISCEKHVAIFVCWKKKSISWVIVRKTGIPKNEMRNKSK